jgi:N-acetylneuraminic acid mutarotase
MGGSSTVPACGGDCGQSGVYGTLGTPAAGNIPGGRYSASGWIDNNGNFWLYGGLGFDSAGKMGLLNDLWEFNPSISEWTWVSGNNTYPASCSASLPDECALSGVYGTLGAPDRANIPGARRDGAGWTDSKGNLWLFGGNGIDANGKWGYLDDFWEYSPSTNEWTWMNGSSTVSCASVYCGQPGVYGTLQTPALGNIPSSRAAAMVWTDPKGNFWLFGGTGVNVADTWGSFQDLWEFQPNTGGSLPVTTTPSFSPDSGTYTTLQTVTINDTTPGATIYYLVNGNTPASEYTTPIPISSSGTIEAIAVANGYANSAVATATYTVQVSPAATPTFSPASGTYATPQTVTISDATPGATIYYTTDNTMPTTSSALYSGPISVSSSETILAIAVANGSTNSAIASAVYTIGSSSTLGEWAGVGGSTVENLPGVYGTLKTPAGGNIPGARDASTSWTDQSGNLWLFGGRGYDANGNLGSLNDLWEFNPSTHQWTWMGGSNTVPCTTLLSVKNCTGQPGVYGALGTPAVSNIPSGRWGAAGWTDSNGHRWLFGGNGVDAGGQPSGLNDLWEFNPSTMEWTWVGGSSKGALSSIYVGQPGVYGTLGVPAAGNVPGSRYGAASWIDRNGNFWLFGGTGKDATGDNVTLNDLWEFNPSIKEWAWMGGSNFINVLVGHQSAVYGTLGVPAAGNAPGSLTGAASWTDNSGNLWLFGGGDLWKFNPSTNEWAWMSGTGAPPCPFDPLIGFNVCTTQPAVYGTLGLPDVRNTPGGGNAAATWTDRNGNFWLFGGYSSDVTGQNGGFYKGNINALWVFNPLTNEWAWMGGDYAASNCSVNILIPIPFIVCDGSQGVTGAQFIPGAANIPAARTGAVSWTDKNGNFWLFSGGITNLSDYTGDVNDLWEYQPSIATFPPATTPIFSLKSGLYASGGPLMISNGMANASIYYTTDGTTPTKASNLYRGAITVSSSETVQAIAIAPGYRNSSVATATYIFGLTPAPSTPTFSLASGTYSSVQKLTISDATPGATIYYTTDGTTPIPSSPVYAAGPITVSSSETVTALAVIGVPGNTVWYGIALPSGGALVSSVATAGYILNLPPTAAPTFSTPSGTYTAPQTVTISDATAGATIYYTTNGTTPTTGSTRYTGTITVFSSETIEAIAVASGYANSAVVSAVYTINQPPIFSLGASPTSLTVKSGGQGTVTLTVTPLNGFNSTVSFACSGLPSSVSCSFSPTAVTPSGSAATTQLTFSASAQSAALRPNSRPLLAMTALSAALCLFGWRRRRGLQLLLLLAVIFTGLGLVSGCGAGTSGSGLTPTPVTSTVSITATSGTLQQRAFLSLTVN